MSTPASAMARRTTVAPSSRSPLVVAFSTGTCPIPTMLTSLKPASDLRLPFQRRDKAKVRCRIGEADPTPYFGLTLLPLAEGRLRPRRRTREHQPGPPLYAGQAVAEAAARRPETSGRSPVRQARGRCLQLDERLLAPVLARELADR